MRKHEQGRLSIVSKNKKGEEVAYMFVKLKDMPKPKGAIRTSNSEMDNIPNTLKYSARTEFENAYLQINAKHVEKQKGKWKYIMYGN